MNSIIFQAAARLLTGLLLLFSVYILVRGHNESGGGFIGALIASAGFAFYTFAYGTEIVRKALHIDPKYICIGGLIMTVLSGFPALFAGDPFLTAMWSENFNIGNSQLAISTVLFFDIGIYLVVVGAILTLLIAMEEDIQ